MKLPQTTIARIVGDFAEVNLGDLRRRDRAQAVGQSWRGARRHRFPRRWGAMRPCKTGKAGFLLHPSLVLDGGAWRRPLGVIYAETLHRTEYSKRSRRSEASGVETAKWKDRESQRWWRGMKASAEALSGCEEVIHVVDREGDSYELLANLLAASQGFVIRVRADRRGREADAPGEEWSTIKEVASTCQGCMERDVPLSRRAAKATARMTGAHPPRKARLARLRFAATRVVIPRPRYLADPGALAARAQSRTCL